MVASYTLHHQLVGRLSSQPPLMSIILVCLLMLAAYSRNICALIQPNTLLYATLPHSSPCETDCLSPLISHGRVLLQVMSTLPVRTFA
eukprot:COSAG01_NODE_1286_length_10900_cov_26.719100_2_plen_88_part_00